MKILKEEEYLKISKVTGEVIGEGLEKIYDALEIQKDIERRKIKVSCQFI